jgi:hypothetical protein
MVKLVQDCISQTVLFAGNELKWVDLMIVESRVSCVEDNESMRECVQIYVRFEMAPLRIHSSPL